MSRPIMPAENYLMRGHEVSYSVRIINMYYNKKDTFQKVQLDKLG